MIHSCPARSGYDWYVECFRFHKKNFWFSFALFMFVAMPGIFLNAIPVLGAVVGTAVSIFAQSGYLISIDRLKRGEVFKPDFLWMGFTNPQIRSALLPWVLLSGGVSIVFALTLAPMMLVQSEMGSADFEKIFTVLFSFALMAFLYASIQIIIFFWIAPIATFKKLPFRETSKLGAQGMAKNVSSMLVHAVVGVGLMLGLFLLLGIVATPMILAANEIRVGGSPGWPLILSSVIVSGLGGLTVFFAITFGLLPAMALMPYFIYQSIYETDTIC